MDSPPSMDLKKFENPKPCIKPKSKAAVYLAFGYSVFDAASKLNAAVRNMDTAIAISTGRDGMRIISKPERNKVKE